MTEDLHHHTHAIPDTAWRDVAIGARESLLKLGYPIVSQCFPDEPGFDNCGHGWADHAGALLLTVKAVAEHQLGHLAPPASVRHRDLRRRGCTARTRLRQPGRR